MKSGKIASVKIILMGYRGDKSLRQVAMVAKYLDNNKAKTSLESE